MPGQKIILKNGSNNLYKIGFNLFEIFFNGMFLFTSIIGLFTPVFMVRDNPLSKLMILFFMFFLSLSGFCFLLNSLFTAKRFDNKFKEKMTNDKLVDEDLFWFIIPGHIVIKLSTVRAAFYASAMVMPRRKNFMLRWFGKYNFRSYARWSDVIISYCFISFSLLAILFLLIGSALKLMGF